jgi:hypothetical protein
MARIAIPIPTPAQATVLRPLEGWDVAGILFAVLSVDDTGDDDEVVVDADDAERVAGAGVEVEDEAVDFTVELDVVTTSSASVMLK